MGLRPTTLWSGVAHSTDWASHALPYNHLNWKIQWTVFSSLSYFIILNAVDHSFITLFSGLLRLGRGDIFACMTSFRLQTVLLLFLPCLWWPFLSLLLEPPNNSVLWVLSSGLISHDHVWAISAILMISITTHLLIPKSLSLAHTLPLSPRTGFFSCVPGISTWRFHRTLNGFKSGLTIIFPDIFLFHFASMKGTISSPSSRYDPLGTLMPPLSLSPFIRSQILLSLLPEFLNFSGLPSCFCPHCLSLDPYYFLPYQLCLLTVLPLCSHLPFFLPASKSHTQSWNLSAYYTCEILCIHSHITITLNHYSPFCFGRG